ncbi:MAG: hypothetical protein JSW03_02965 [Candidatus Eiseniibacteriota bacterium]|nr:MAG: hypothetical protein JSW03_02965 [Candidatus Eisenbacteria bacterium]
MPSQVKRLILLFGIAAAALVLVRFLLVPDSFGRYGHYRADAVDEVAGMEIRYAGHLLCQECHDDVDAVKSGSMHEAVSCEACHGPGNEHAEDPFENRLSAPRGRRRCAYCHSYNPSRPTGFPQIEPDEHGGEEPCITCHNPHQPEPLVGIEDCEACHTEIAKTKSKSHHLSLHCTTCHATQERHPGAPREMRPDKPRTRSFCGQCHGEDASSPETIPRVDMATHGEDYLCWQCHYPHFPEGRR